MEFDGYYQLGYISKTHGVKGNVTITLNVDDPSKYKKIKAVFYEKDGLLLSVNVKSTSLLGKNLIVGLEGFNDMNAAETIVGKELFLPLSALPPLKKNQLYFHEAIGMLVIDITEGELGVIEKIYELPQQPVAAVNFKGKELLFPFLTRFFEKVDRENKVLHVNLPEGLIDIYR